MYCIYNGSLYLSVTFCIVVKTASPLYHLEKIFDQTAKLRDLLKNSIKLTEQNVDIQRNFICRTDETPPNEISFILHIFALSIILTSPS